MVGRSRRNWRGRLRTSPAAARRKRGLFVGKRPGSTAADMQPDGDQEENMMSAVTLLAAAASYTGDAKANIRIWRADAPARAPRHSGRRAGPATAAPAFHATQSARVRTGIRRGAR